jgi:hypothetical protein
MRLPDVEVDFLKTCKTGIYCIALKDEVWQAQLAELDDIDDDEGGYLRRQQSSLLGMV